MSQLAAPVAESKPHGHAEEPGECSLFPLLPPPLQGACQENTHLLQYLHLLPLQEVGFPAYYPVLTRKLGDGPKHNLIYPVSQDILVHIFSDTKSNRNLYIPVESSMGLDLEAKLRLLDMILLDYTDEISRAETEEDRQAVLLRCVEKAFPVLPPGKIPAAGAGDNGKRGNGRPTAVTPQEMQALKYLIMRNKLGMGVLQPMIADTYIEDVSCSGLGPIFVEHKIFHSLTSAVVFNTHEELDEFVMRLSERVKKPVTMRHPIVDATLPDGSRINIVYGKEVSQRGSNFTIRKFSETPLSILEIIDFGTLDYSMAAYLSVVMEEGMNLFVAGETASGKTTLLNAMTTFIPYSNKVVSIEDTPELQVPHKNWIREVSQMSQADQGASVTMFQLLRAALRQRPNIIVIGEIRGEEGSVAFQAMQTGHTVMATFHAASVEKLVQRLTGNPINIPKTYVDSLNVVVITNAVKLPNGKRGRRIISINEIIGYEASSDSFSFVEVFRWDPATDGFEFVGNKNSFLLEQKIAPKRGIPPTRKWEIYALIERRARVLERLHKEAKVTNFYELLEVMFNAQKQGVF
ncbi:MAG: type II/IV secretion system ATPase subunit [Chloroflexi bacterium]|nr:type II/IV secretion system ATPase subunit [Chloroflexota bacterium]